MKYIITSLGCKVNQYENRAVESMLVSHGHRACAEGEQADIVIVNTCAVTAESGRKSRQVIRKLKDENPQAVIAVSGCYSQLDPDKVKELGADIIFGTNDKKRFVEEIEQHAVNSPVSVNVDNPFKRKGFEYLTTDDYHGKTRAMLKIQDGCVNFCTYCIIPYTRGSLRSLPPEIISDTVKNMSDKGYTEVILTGIEIASYGKDIEGNYNLSGAVEAALKASANIRVRLGSLEPTVISEDFCRRLSAYPNLCRHFHLSLQSGCDTVLKRMNRKYNTAEFTQVCERLRKYFPGCALTADVIAGFPGETEEEHNETVSFLRQCCFSKIHVFPYSRRPGTPADKMSGQLTAAVKNRRAKEIQELADESEKSYINDSVGSGLKVIFETETDGIWYGHSDTYIQCVCPDARIIRGEITACIGTKRNGFSLECSIE